MGCVMSDVDTREQAADVVKERCPLRTVLKAGKPCPYFGPSETCRDCSYDWLSITDDVLKVVKARRASYEKEREKNKKLIDQIESFENDRDKLRLGVKALRDLFEFGQGLFKEVTEDENGSESEEGSTGRSGTEAS